MANLAPIIYNTESISARHAPSLNAAFKELFDLSGIRPRVLSPDGGARTKEECIALGLDWSLSDHYEDSPKGRAAFDLDNQRTFRNWNGPLFVATLAKYGWRNIQINGQPFPSEPWHFANHDITPAGSTGAPFPNTESETDMALFLGNNTVAWPNGYCNTYNPNVYEAMRLVVEEGKREPSRVETYVRESWAAVTFLQKRTVDATIAELKKQGFIK